MLHKISTLYNVKINKNVEITYRFFLTSNSKRVTLRSLLDLTFDIICI